MDAFFIALLVIVTLLTLWFAGFVVYRLKTSAR